MNSYQTVENPYFIDVQDKCFHHYIPSMFELPMVYEDCKAQDGGEGGICTEGIEEQLFQLNQLFRLCMDYYVIC